MLKIKSHTEHKVNFSVKRELEGYDRQARKTPKIYAGYPGDKVSKGLIRIAKWMEYGTKHIPARPFMRRAAHRNRARYTQQLIKIAKRAANGANLERLLRRQGVIMASDIQRSMMSGSFAPLDPVTIKRKKSRKPLITRLRRLYNEVNYTIRKK